MKFGENIFNGIRVMVQTQMMEALMADGWTLKISITKTSLLFVVGHNEKKISHKHH